MKPIPCSIAAAAILVLCSGPLAADPWPQWRGPRNDGVSRESQVPTRWSATENVAWKLKLPGMAGSTPIVWNDRIFLTSEAGSDIVLLCLDTAGKELWRRKLGTGGGRRVRSDEGNGSSPSPSTDGQHVYAMAGSGDLACFDFDGKEVWRVQTQKRYGPFQIQFGMHMTPALYGDHLYLFFFYTGGTWVVALNKKDGSEAWKLQRDTDATAECEHAYTSPFVWTNGQDAYLVVHGQDYTTAHALKDGKELWRLGDLNSKARYNYTLRFVASPLATPDLIVVPSAKNGPVVAVKPDAKGRIAPGSPAEAWRMPRDTPDVPSPLLHEGLVYLCRENGVLICMDAATGKVHYSQRLHGARYRASPVYAAGHVYCTARDGYVSVVKAGPKFERVAENVLPDQIAASPAISGGRIYLRGFDHLYAIGPAK